MPPIEFRGTQMVTGSLSSQLVPLCVCISSHEGACHDFLVILAMPTTCAHGTGVAIPLHSSYHTAITFEPLCSHIKPEGLTSSPLRGPTQAARVATFASPRVLRWVVCGGSTGCHDRRYAPGTWARCSGDALTCQRAWHGYQLAVAAIRPEAVGN